MAKKIEEIVEEKGYYATNPKGMSMFPLLNKKCNIIVVKPELPLKQYDVALYKRESGEYVLHRVMGRNEQGYIFCGDNQWRLEYGIQDEQIVATLKEWYKNNRKHTVEDLRYKRYVSFWCKSLKLRHFILWFCHRCIFVKELVKEIGGKIFGKG